jgi:hypothetical protein
VNGLKLHIGVLGHKEHVYGIRKGIMLLSEKLIFTFLVTSYDFFDPTIMSGMVQNMGIRTSVGSFHTELTKLWRKVEENVILGRNGPEISSNSSGFDLANNV